MCPILCDSMGHRSPDLFVHGILQARILEWVDISSSRGSSWPRDQTPYLLHWHLGSLPLVLSGILTCPLDIWYNSSPYTLGTRLPWSASSKNFAMLVYLESLHSLDFLQQLSIYWHPLFLAIFRIGSSSSLSSLSPHYNHVLYVIKFILPT